MKSVYERTNLIITEFEAEDVIATSAAATPVEEVIPEVDNYFTSYNKLAGKMPGSWF